MRLLNLLFTNVIRTSVQYTRGWQRVKYIEHETRGLSLPRGSWQDCDLGVTHDAAAVRRAPCQETRNTMDSSQHGGGAADTAVGQPTRQWGS